jgi:hypothetical protein
MQEDDQQVGTKDGSQIRPGMRRLGKEGGFGCQKDELYDCSGEEPKEGAAAARLAGCAIGVMVFVGALHVVDGRQLGIDQEVDVAQQVLQEGITLLVEGGLVALDTIAPLRMVERERRGGLMVHFRAFMCCCVVSVALLQSRVQIHEKASCLNDQSQSQVACLGPSGTR